MLLLFLIPAAVIGLVLRRPLARFMAWFVHHAELELISSVGRTTARMRNVKKYLTLFSHFAVW